MTFTVAIVGRPNVGKSTLFNRMVGRRLALVHDTPGLTRDWRAAEADLLGLSFRVLDTAGLEERFDDSIEGRMRRQTERALAEADMALLVVDVRAGITPVDRHFADWLRKQGIPAALVVNKCESVKAAEGMYEAYELGLGEPILVSAEHGLGMDALRDLLRPRVEAAASAQTNDAAEPEEDVETLFEKYEEGAGTGLGEEEEDAAEAKKPIRIAIVGRPNVGKSTMLNALLGEERSMTGPEAGITRDAVRVDWEYAGRGIQLVDTAGLRRRARVQETIEKMSTSDSLRAVRLAQVVILVIEAGEPLSHQDITIAAHVIEEGRALVIALNKWDTVTEKDALLDNLRHKLDTTLAQVQGVPLVPVSALTGRRLNAVMDAALEVYDLWNRRVSTGKLNRWLAGMEARNPAPLAQGRPNRLRYITQIKTRPPTFALWVGRPDDYPDSHRRYLINGLRRDFTLPATPVRFIVKSSRNPFAD